MQCPPRKETRSLTGRCVHRAASSRTYCRPEKREGLKKTRATTLLAFWAAGSRRSGACGDSRVHCLREPHETQRSYHRILPILTLYRVPQIILNQHSRKRAMHKVAGHSRGAQRSYPLALFFVAETGAEAAGTGATAASAFVFSASPNLCSFTRATPRSSISITETP